MRLDPGRRHTIRYVVRISGKATYGSSGATVSFQHVLFSPYGCLAVTRGHPRPTTNQQLSLCTLTASGILVPASINLLLSILLMAAAFCTLLTEQTQHAHYVFRPTGVLVAHAPDALLLPQVCASDTQLG